MKPKLSAGLGILTLILGVVLIAPTAEACKRKGHCGRCTKPFGNCGCVQPFCGACQMAPSGCGCGGPVPMMSPAPVLTPGPVITPSPVLPGPTMMGPSPCITTMQPVIRTEIRQQAKIIDVPVTTYRQVTVDEGSYQQVWVPKLTTKTVQQTTIQKQVRYENVPYQVVQQVPVGPVMSFAPYSTTAMGVSPIPMATNPTPAPRLSYAPIESADVATPDPYAHHHHHGDHDHSHHDHAPTPQISSNEGSGSWAKVPAKSNGEGKVELQAYELPAEVAASARPVPPPTRSAGRPSAITAWHAQNNFRN